MLLVLWRVSLISDIVLMVSEVSGVCVMVYLWSMTLVPWSLGYHGTSHICVMVSAACGVGVTFYVAPG